MPAAPGVCLEVFVGMSVLIIGEPAPAAATMFEQEDLPSTPADASHLLQGSDGIGECAGRERRSNRIETLIRKIQVLSVHDFCVHAYVKLMSFLACDLQHARAEVGRGDPARWRKER